MAQPASGGQVGWPPGNRLGGHGTTRLLEAVRSHWGIGNSLHWSLDAAFGEDQCRVRKDNGPQNMAALRQISHSLLKRETSLKAGIQGKRLQAVWREDCLLKVLRS